MNDGSYIGSLPDDSTVEYEHKAELSKFDSPTGRSPPGYVDVTEVHTAVLGEDG